MGLSGGGFCVDRVWCVGVLVLGCGGVVELGVL